jgi:hypothetical protein
MGTFSQVVQRSQVTTVQVGPPGCKQRVGWMPGTYQSIYTGIGMSRLLFRLSCAVH